VLAGRLANQHELLCCDVIAEGVRTDLDRLHTTAAAIQAALHSPQLLSPVRLSAAYGLTVRASVALLRQFNTEIAELEAELITSFEGHPDAEILCSLPGLGSVLGARVLAEFGDDPTRYKDARSRRCYAGTAPITRASGTRNVVLARTARNRRMDQACYLWAFSALRPSPGARRFYDRQRANGKTHHQALRALANRLVGVLHGCLSNASFTTNMSPGQLPRRLPLDSLRSWDVWPAAG
jgi:transposase